MFICGSPMHMSRLESVIVILTRVSMLGLTSSLDAFIFRHARGLQRRAALATVITHPKKSPVIKFPAYHSMTYGFDSENLQSSIKLTRNYRRCFRRWTWLGQICTFTSKDSGAVRRILRSSRYLYPWCL